MTTRRTPAAHLICAFSLISLICVSMASAQQRESTNPQTSVPIVTATASAEGVDLVSVGRVHQTRLQIFSPNGAQVFDTNFQLGNLVSWQLRDQQGADLADGTYLYLVTVKDFSERITQKYGTAVLERERVYLEQPGRAELSQAHAGILETSRQSEIISLVDRISAAGLNQSASSTSTDSNSTTGTKPSAAQESSATPTGTENLDGTGSQNYLAKWTDDIGTLGNSTLFENAFGRVGLGTTTPGARFHVVGTQGSTGAGTFQLDTPTLFSGWFGAYPAFEIINTNQTNNNVSLFQFSDAPSGASHAGIGAVNVNHANKWGNLFFYTKQADGYQIRMGIYGGNVGIGTTIPGQRLSVNGVIESLAGGFKFPDGTTLTSVGTLGKILASRVTISAANSPYSAGTTEDIIGVNVTSAPVTVILPAANSVSSGKILIVKNEAGDASINNITIQRRGSDFINANQTAVTITFGIGTAAFKFYSDGVSRWYQF